MVSLLQWQDAGDAHPCYSTLVGSRGTMVTGGINVGTIVWVTKVPLALYMKPKNAPRLWRPALIVEENKDGYIAVYSDGEIIKCHKNHIRPFSMEQ